MTKRKNKRVRYMINILLFIVSIACFMGASRFFSGVLHYDEIQNELKRYSSLHDLCGWTGADTNYYDDVLKPERDAKVQEEVITKWCAETDTVVRGTVIIIVLVIWLASFIFLISAVVRLVLKYKREKDGQELAQRVQEYKELLGI